MLSLYSIAFLIGSILIRINVINFPLFVGILITGAVPLAQGLHLFGQKSWGKVEVTLLLIVTTILASPLITPSYIYLFLRDRVTINIQNMFFEMALIIFIPLLASFYFKKNL